MNFLFLTMYIYSNMEAIKNYFQPTLKYKVLIDVKLNNVSFFDVIFNMYKLYPQIFLPITSDTEIYKTIMSWANDKLNKKESKLTEEFKRANDFLYVIKDDCFISTTLKTPITLIKFYEMLYHCVSKSDLKNNFEFMDVEKDDYLLFPFDRVFQIPSAILKEKPIYINEIECIKLNDDYLITNIQFLC